LEWNIKMCVFCFWWVAYNNGFVGNSIIFMKIFHIYLEWKTFLIKLPHLQEIFAFKMLIHNCNSNFQSSNSSLFGIPSVYTCKNYHWHWTNQTTCKSAYQHTRRT
jgi:hypothetical protein